MDMPTAYQISPSQFYVTPKILNGLSAATAELLRAQETIKRRAPARSVSNQKAEEPSIILDSRLASRGPNFTSRAKCYYRKQKTTAPSSNESSKPHGHPHHQAR
ncbi:hypothetical protein [Paraburkholderia kirstenboschensis]|uniref:Uncharacterized protein n=1 Tax=Paraburkholderia kirstenboschensis TaxID=1245436 RepID=A0ABZ0EHR2_9BURK|nr:hypothetical protein [Paraburkholderia kirstenboschensis]WOD16758.1 hypothetical protein RW095_12840 [Paraburkholderia kirstenboschensis]